MQDNFTIFYYLNFLSRDTQDSWDRKGKKRPFLTHLCWFHPLHEHLHISRAITSGSSPLLIASGRTRTGNPWFVNASRYANH